MIISAMVVLLGVRTKTTKDKRKTVCTFLIRLFMFSESKSSPINEPIKNIINAKPEKASITPATIRRVVEREAR